MKDTLIEIVDSLTALGYIPRLLSNEPFDPKEDRFKVEIDGLWVAVIARADRIETRFTIDNLMAIVGAHGRTALMVICAAANNA